MATIELRLSNKIQKETGRAEIMIRFFHNHIDIYAKSEVFINPDFFEYYIDRKKTVKPQKPIPANAITASVTVARKNGWILRNSGIIVVCKRRIKNDEVRYHELQAEQIEKNGFSVSSTNKTTRKNISRKRRGMCPFMSWLNSTSLNAGWRNHMLESSVFLAGQPPDMKDTSVLLI